MIGNVNDVVVLTDPKLQQKEYKAIKDLVINDNYTVGDLLADYKQLKLDFDNASVELNKHSKQLELTNKLITNITKLYDSRIVNLENTIKEMGGKL